MTFDMIFIKTSRSRLHNKCNFIINFFSARLAQDDGKLKKIELNYLNILKFTRELVGEQRMNNLGGWWGLFSRVAKKSFLSYTESSGIITAQRDFQHPKERRNVSLTIFNAFSKGFLFQSTTMIRFSHRVSFFPAPNDLSYQFLFSFC